jgi:hypothetical protein
MSFYFVAFFLIVLQHFPPPPPPQGFEIQSAYVQENFDGSLENNTFVPDYIFRRAVRNIPVGSSFNGYNGFPAIWAAVQDGRIDQLTRSNWRVLIDATRTSGDDATRTLICEAAKADGEEFNGFRCRDFYLPLSDSLNYLLFLSSLFVFWIVNRKNHLGTSFFRILYQNNFCALQKMSKFAKNLS